MESLSSAQFLKVFCQEQDASNFDEIAEQALFLLNQRFELQLLLEFSSYVVNYQHLLSYLQRIQAINVFLTHYSSISQNLREILARFCEDTLLDVADALAQGNRVIVKNVKILTQFAELGPLSQVDSLSQHLSFYFSVAEPSEQAKLLLCSFYSGLSLRSTVIYLLSQPKTTWPADALSPRDFKDLAAGVYCVENKVIFVQVIENLSHIFALPGDSQVKTVLLQQFALAAVSGDAFQRRNAILTLEYFPLAKSDANATLAELKFLEASFEDEVAEIRAAAAEICVEILQKVDDVYNNIQLKENLFKMCFDEQLRVRKIAVQAILALLIKRDDATLQLCRNNIQQIKELFNDLSAVRAQALKIYSYLLQNNHIPAQTDVLELLNDYKIGQKLKLSAIFPEGSASFVNQPDLCYKQIFIGCQVCKELIISVLGAFLSRVSLDEKPQQIAVVSSVAAVCAAVYIENGCIDILKLSLQAYTLLQQQREQNNTRRSEEAVRLGIEHANQAYASEEFERKFLDAWEAEKSILLMLIAVILQRNAGILQKIKAGEIDHLELPFNDYFINSLIDLDYQSYFSTLEVEENVKFYLACVSVVGNLEEQEPMEYFDSKQNIRSVICEVVNFTRQSEQQQEENNVFGKLSNIDMKYDKYNADLPILLSLLVDVYLNLKHFSISMVQSENVLKFLEKCKFAEFNQEICNLIISRVSEGKPVDCSRFNDSEKRLVLEILSRKE